MRHKVSGRKLGRSSAHRASMRRTLINQLFTHGRIRTTEAKAKSIKGEAERIISIAKRGLKAGEGTGAVTARRLTLSRLNDKTVVDKLFSDIAPRYAERAGGYTRILKLGQRLGDAASIVLLELVEE
jgi:large subunit ribosomal protein L17